MNISKLYMIAKYITNYDDINNGEIINDNKVSEPIHTYDEDSYVNNTLIHTKPSDIFFLSVLLLTCSSALIYRMYGCIKLKCRTESLNLYAINNETIESGHSISIDGVIETIENSNDEPCSICLESFLISNRTITLECNHKYHSGCIMDWLHRDNICPLCRQVVPLN